MRLISPGEPATFDRAENRLSPLLAGVSSSEISRPPPFVPRPARCVRVAEGRPHPAISPRFGLSSSRLTNRKVKNRTHANSQRAARHRTRWWRTQKLHLSVRACLQELSAFTRPPGAIDLACVPIPAGLITTPLVAETTRPRQARLHLDHSFAETKMQIPAHLTRLRGDPRHIAGRSNLLADAQNPLIRSVKAKRPVRVSRRPPGAVEQVQSVAGSR